jgi:predicted transcriptional regulator
MAAPALTDLQLALLRAVWQRGEATVQDVQAALERPLAQSTVATLLGRMERRGLITHRVVGRQFVYRALVTEPDVQRTVVEELTALVSNLIQARDVRPDDLARVKALIEAKERTLRKDPP